MKVKKSNRKIRNIVIGSFSFISSLMIVAGSVYLFVGQGTVKEENTEMKEIAYSSCVNAGKLRNFLTEEEEGKITFYSPNLRNTPYSTINAMTMTASACEGFKLDDACIGPGCESDRGIGVPFHFTLVQRGGA